MFRKVLIANRGEIALRVIRTLQEMGIRAVAVYSDPDRGAPFVRQANEAYGLEGATSAETYLRGDKILDIARMHGAEAVHPGYGFLSENADFAAACKRAGVVFIGPGAEAIRAMGDKIVARERLARIGVPVVPGCELPADASADDLRGQARRIGYPLLIKAAAGGGGKGMRLVETEDRLHASIEAAAREAQSSFRDGRVFLEKYVDRPRHVEFQILGDGHGCVVHLFERECSIQRRHQKIIEESPSAALDGALRQTMGQAAVRAAQAFGYTNTGTVEFILDAQGAFYFLEVNTRLQVEHPVTELTVRQDLVRLQLAVAAGAPLPFAQEDLRPEGHAIQCRVYAEDPARGFLPSVGVLDKYLPPTGPNIRVDSGVEAGSEVTVHYDPMLAKVIVWGQTRGEALQRMRWALEHFVILGVTTNLEFLRQVIGHPEFEAGRTHTHFLQDHAAELGGDAQPPAEALMAAAWTAMQVAIGGRPGAHAAGYGAADADSPWRTAGAWRAC